MNILELISKGKPRKKVKDLKYSEVYSTLKNLDIENERELKPVQKTWRKIVNSRNPFTRLFSAWNDKSRTHLDGDGNRLKEDTWYNWFEIRQLDVHFHSKYYPGWKVFESERPTEGRNVSWEAFVKYVAANPGDKG